MYDTKIELYLRYILIDLKSIPFANLGSVFYTEKLLQCFIKIVQLVVTYFNKYRNSITLYDPIMTRLNVKES